ncbi:hypothetical protein, partial [Nocardioides fonticola]
AGATSLACSGPVGRLRSARAAVRDARAVRTPAEERVAARERPLRQAHAEAARDAVRDCRDGGGSGGSDRSPNRKAVDPSRSVPPAPSTAPTTAPASSTAPSAPSPTTPATPATPASPSATTTGPTATPSPTPSGGLLCDLRLACRR